MESKYELKELTPKDMQCGCGGCPSIHEYSDKYLIVRSVVDPVLFGLEGRVGESEILISVPKILIDKFRK